MNDFDLAKKCTIKDNDAWRTFLNRFHTLILKRIAQIFFRYGFHPTSNDTQEAYDQTIDHFLFSNALERFAPTSPLEHYVRRVTTNVVIDWYRKRQSLKKRDCEFDLSMETLLEDPHFPIQNDLIDKLMEDGAASEEVILANILLIRYIQFSDINLEKLSRISKTPIPLISQLLAELEERLQSGTQKSQNKYSNLRYLFSIILYTEKIGTNQPLLEKRKRQFDVLLAEYRKNGFEPFPTRAEISEIFNWDINKTDRLMRKLKSRLRTINKFNEQKNTLAS